MTITILCEAIQMFCTNSSYFFFYVNKSYKEKVFVFCTFVRLSHMEVTSEIM